ncbi:MAG: AMP-binding protein [Acidimicrobiales bacterium]
MGSKAEQGLVRRLGLLDPSRLAATVGGALRWGPSLASMYRAAAIRHPNRPAVIDHGGTTSFFRLDVRSSALAHGLLSLGIEAGQDIGLLCRNHRGFVEANLAAAKAGLNPVYLNTAFAPPQLAEVIEREGVVGLIHDLEFQAAVRSTSFAGPVVVADGPDQNKGHAPKPSGVGGTWSMADLRRVGRGRLTPLRPRITTPVLLTSGTTGLPQGARRNDIALDPRAALGFMRRIPYRQDDVFVVASPLFHAWGLSQLVLAAALGAPVVLSGSFSPARTVASVVEHQATVLCVVPIMLQRMLAAEDIDLSTMTSLRIVATSGSALPAAVAGRWMDRVGDSLYNLYGSTEVGQATIADPEDLRQAQGTAGRAIPGSEVAILDEAGNRLPPGRRGRIFVGNRAQLSSYTGGETKEVVDGLMASGDVGHFDDDGRLFIEGRSDDMIVSGGENVFPSEVEDLLMTHPTVVAAAVIGVPDDEFGQRLAAYVVLASGSQLDEAALRRLVAGHLARHKVPRDVILVDRLPRTATGKVLRRQLSNDDDDR